MSGIYLFCCILEGFWGSGRLSTDKLHFEVYKVCEVYTVIFCTSKAVSRSVCICMCLVLPPSLFCHIVYVLCSFSLQCIIFLLFINHTLCLFLVISFQSLLRLVYLYVSVNALCILSCCDFVHNPTTSLQYSQ